MGPTLAVHGENAKKLLPVTVTVLSTYAAVGATDVAAGDATTLSGVSATVTVTPELVNVTCTDDAVPGDAVAFVPVPITTTTDVALEH